MARVCPGCSNEARDGDRFCARCGTSIASVEASTARPRGFCTSCGAPLGPDDRFCARCGAAAGVRAEAEGRDEAPFDPDDFFSEWNGRAPTPEGAPTAPDEAKTEQVPIQPAARRDTAVLPEMAPATPRDPSAAPAAAAPEPRRGPGFPWGATFAFLGAVAVVASSALPWLSGEAAVLPRNVPVAALLFGETATRGPSLGLVLLGLGMAGALVALLTMAVPALRFLRRLVGLVTLAAPVLFVVRVVGSGAELARLLDVLAAGVYVAAAGALVQLVAGRWFRR